jgi:hypothetical protein
LILNIDLVLDLGLGNVPENAGHFCQILIVCSMIDAVTGPFYCAIIATGKIAKYQILISISFLLDLLLSFLLFKMGIEPYLILISRIMTRGFLNAFVGMYFLRSLLGHDMKLYLRKTISPILLFLLIISPVAYVVYSNFDGIRLLVVSVSVVSLTFLFLSYYILFAPSERQYIMSFVKKFKERG